MGAQVRVLLVGDGDIACGFCGQEFAQDNEPLSLERAGEIIDELRTGAGDGAIGICMHHGPTRRDAMPFDAIYTPVVVGQVRGIIHDAGTEAVIPDEPIRVAPPGLTAQAAAEEADAAGGGLGAGGNVEG